MNKILFDEIKIHKRILERLSTKAEKLVFPKTKNEISDRLYPHLINLAYKINFFAGNKSKRDQNRTRLGSFNFVAVGDTPSTLFTFKVENPDIQKEEKILEEASSIKRYLGDDWKEMYKNKVSKEVIVYENRLCEDCYSMEDSEIEFVNDEELEPDVGEFRFVKKDLEDMNKEINVENVKVDELGIENFSDLMYWETGKNMEMPEMEKILDEIEDNK